MTEIFLGDLPVGNVDDDRIEEGHGTFFVLDCGSDGLDPPKALRWVKIADDNVDRPGIREIATNSLSSVPMTSVMEGLAKTIR